MQHARRDTIEKYIKKWYGTAAAENVLLTITKRRNSNEQIDHWVEKFCNLYLNIFSWNEVRDYYLFITFWKYILIIHIIEHIFINYNIIYVNRKGETEEEKSFMFNRRRENDNIFKYKVMWEQWNWRIQMSKHSFHVCLFATERRHD